MGSKFYAILSTSSGGGGSGTVTSVSVSTNGVGIGGTVANASTTPAITITGAAPLASPALTGVPTAPTAAAGTSTTQLATTAFVTSAVKQPSPYNLSTITADPAPGVVGTYYRTNYASNGTFTLPTSPATGSAILIKQIAFNTLTIAGTVDGNAAFTLTQYQSVLFIYNGTTWDAN